MSEPEARDLFDLEGRVCLVAGGAGYLGTSVCWGLASAGATVVVADVDESRLQQTVSLIEHSFPSTHPGGVLFDVSAEASIEAVVNGIVDSRGRLDALVNATFRSTAKRLEDLTAAEFDSANRLNITSSFLLARTAASKMQSGGSIVLYSSMYGLLSPNAGDYPEGMNPNPIEYGAGKAAIAQMVRYLAAHYGPQGIRVNAVAPGAFPSDRVQSQNPEFVGRLARKAMLGRIGRREETVGPVLFLASRASSFVTGQVLSVDGGITSW